ncbi:MAG: Gfo/Idh/MocA family protein [Planctomycetota bacterium]|jgi:predicted dehydrogenase
MPRISRRRFLEESMLAAAAAAALPVGQAVAGEQPSRSANEKLSVAVIGVRGRGNGHAQAFADRDDCEVTYMCDADENVVAARAKGIGDRQGRQPKAVLDMRRIFDDRSVDVVSIATPNHWHALAAIWAMQAGKDVYVEKPVSHNVSEGRRMAQVMEKYQRICQGGTQYRSGGSNRATARYIKEGKLGRIKSARCYTYRPRNPIGPPGEYPVPEEIDYNLWAGPAPMQVPLRRQNFHYDWHWIWDYGNGELGNNSVHRVDCLRLLIDSKGLGRGVICYGGRQYDDAAETPNTQVVVHDFGETTIVQEVRNLETGGPPKGAGILVEGTEGYIICSLSSNTVFDPDGKMVEKIEGEGENHFANFVKAVRSRKVEDLNAPIVEGHVSTALTHLGNLSYLLGQPAAPDKIVGKLESLEVNYDAVEAFEAIRTHLADNDVDVGTRPLVLGPWLAIDAENETFIDNPAADALLTRQYREPFVVPKADAI